MVSIETAIDISFGTSALLQSVSADLMFGFQAHPDTFAHLVRSKYTYMVNRGFYYSIETFKLAFLSYSGRVYLKASTKIHRKPTARCIPCTPSVIHLSLIPQWALGAKVRTFKTVGANFQSHGLTGSHLFGILFNSIASVSLLCTDQIATCADNTFQSLWVYTLTHEDSGKSRMRLALRVLIFGKKSGKFSTARITENPRPG